MTFKIFHSFPKLKYGFSTKADGVIELAGQDFLARQNFCAYLQKSDINPKNTVSAKLVHSSLANVVSAKNAGQTITGVDALVCHEAGLFLTITASDCFPVYFFDSVKNTTALAHSGWRGTVGGLIAEVVKKLGSNPRDLLVGIGPGIGPCHFEIQADVLEKFNQYKKFITKRNGKLFVDLRQIIFKQLIDCGLNNKNIETSPDCTYCLKDKYFSFRRDKPNQIQAQLAYLGVKF